MMGKIIVHGENRQDAIKKMKATLDELVITGVKTNQDFCYMILNNQDYEKGIFDTGYIAKRIEQLLEYDDFE
jgi:acetyl-CoA carboxylase biotin carboxylase subunit